MAVFYQLTHEPPSHAGLSKRKARQSMRLSAYTEGLTGVWEEKRYSRPDRWYCVDDGKLTLHCKTLKKKDVSNKQTVPFNAIYGDVLCKSTMDEENYFYSWPRTDFSLGSISPLMCV